MQLTASLLIRTAITGAFVLAAVIVPAQITQTSENPPGVTRYELQRSLGEIDEQRRHLETALDPIDSVLRLLALDTGRVAALTRSPLVDRDLARVRASHLALSQYPMDGALSRRFIDAVSQTARDFAIRDDALSSRLLLAPAAQDYLARSPNAAVVPIGSQPPPNETPLWEKVRDSDYGRLRLPRVTDADVVTFEAAASDSGFQAYKQTVIASITRRLAQVRDTREATRNDIQRLRRRAAEIAHAIGEQETTTGRLDARLVAFGLPALAVVVILLLLLPRLYTSPELQQWFFSSGMLLELIVLILLSTVTLFLALADRIHGEVIGVLLGGMSGYLLGRSLGRRAPPGPAVTAAVAPQETPPSSGAVPVGNVANAPGTSKVAGIGKATGRVVPPSRAARFRS